MEQMGASVIQDARHLPPSAGTADQFDDVEEDDDHEDADDWRSEFKGIYRRLVPVPSTVPTQHQPVQNGEQAAIRAELDKYLSRPNMHPAGDPLIFWRENEDLYPKVSLRPTEVHSTFVYILVQVDLFSLLPNQSTALVGAITLHLAASYKAISYRLLLPSIKFISVYIFLYSSSSCLGSRKCGRF